MAAGAAWRSWLEGSRPLRTTASLPASGPVIQVTLGFAIIFDTG
jgi:hypothetical protein